MEGLKAIEKGCLRFHFQIDLFYYPLKLSFSKILFTLL
ncbi:hypothetical protein CSE_01350 [Caldisericum exile AZM16c01]|uniref:Uncharacterized protein n=1 Tax=Caldisericum exile (strain DSM 21853 / NBRC 104410 / AZM16c01) TaxID=511051 RepID=A0A7U6GD96_CALEA|nr:hypothetical protein CSE_01350 [Caldisericum exile AZM16c01]